MGWADEFGWCLKASRLQREHEGGPGAVKFMETESKTVNARGRGRRLVFKENKSPVRKRKSLDGGDGCRAT